ncbi:UDP-N-acetylmuramoyl-L-alanyl-D-glutamate--2,6-diaminopimelate ligase [Oceanicoccus sagamiensis]|uniref:UDP-N-acetylmuramoyl-L-alanyl-D-glutamate--2,6-diaminopimelate ligase n=2 Tax=Oceanicoccus sagamiensis TaxID=716816 RepID=A0A1X9NEC1_9GAMM|nr:UDP-N-acetylmuramoyl-L-alanyl-D-glutamate--2,6-diaminopimelate ligase [Oceanicoccus sagamiensis]
MDTNNTRRLADLININDQELAAIAVSGIELDSREVTAGDVFLACAGFASDGRDYIDQAIAAGAVAVLAEQDERWPNHSMRHGIPIVVVEKLSQKISAIAGQFYKHPSQQLPVLAVTGTNGKTSCTQLLQQLLNALDKSCGVIGTLGAGADGELAAGINTTPSAVAIQKLLANWLADNISTAAMEVSSHGLEQGRVQALQFELALFTNLSRDHLDYHGSMQAYAEAKARLFRQPGLKHAVINIDDNFSSSLLSIINDDVEVTRFSIDAAQDKNKRIDVWVENISYHPDGVSAELHSPWGEFELHSPLLGSFNLSNVVAVVSSLGVLGYPVATVIEKLQVLGTIAGRMEKVTSATDINVVVDYAHTPDALEKALVAMRQHSEGDVWCVFGCGGDRDQGKRSLMGETVQRYADHVVVTSDNPRHESASDIINQILGGVNCPSLVEEDRAKAIDFTIANAKAGDCVLLAGKGHEEYQQVGDLRVPFSDIKQARLALAKRAGVSQ